MAKKKKLEEGVIYLYGVPQESKIECTASDGSTFVIFHHLDGMYSYCTTEKGAVVHLSVHQTLKKEGDHYVLA